MSNNAASTGVSRLCKCDKVDGLAKVMGGFITWYPKRPGDAEVRKVDIGTVVSVRRTPERSAKGALLKVEYKDGNMVLEFASKSGKPDFTERLAVEEAIQNLRRVHKQQQQAAERAPSAEEAAAAAAAARPAPPPQPKANVSLETNLPPGEFERRRDILRSNTEVDELHKRLVGRGVITDSTFWEFIKYKLDSAAAEHLVTKASETRRGYPTAWEDPTTVADQQAGTQSFVLTAAKRNKIFALYPNIELAFKANVPHKMSQEEFWQKYSRSRYFHNARGGTATEADKLFALYDAQAPREMNEEFRKRKANLTLPLNLDRVDDHRLIHVQNVHEQGSSNIKDDIYLPKLQQLNRHGKLVMDTNTSRQSAEVAWQPTAEFQHPMLDLEDPEMAEIVPLKLKNRTMFFEGFGGVQDFDKGDPKVLRSQAKRLRRGLDSWSPNLDPLAQPRKGSMQVYQDLFGLSNRS